MIHRKDDASGPEPATLLGVTRVGSAAYRDAAKSAKALLAAQELDRLARRTRRWEELCAQLLTTSEGVHDERTLFARAYAVVRGDRTAALTPGDAALLRACSKAVWTRYERFPAGTIGDGMEQAATASAPSSSRSVDGGGSTAVVSVGEDMAPRSCSPEPLPATGMVAE